jgi:hypothetical protein
MARAIQQGFSLAQWKFGDFFEPVTFGDDLPFCFPS